MTPVEGEVIRYRVKRHDGTWREGESKVQIVWGYDEGHPILDLADGTSVHTQFGDTWVASGEDQ